MGKGSSGKQSENASQLRDTIYRAAVNRTKYYEYKDASGKTVTGETAKAFSGAYRDRVAASATINRTTKGEYSADVAQYAKMSDKALQDELKKAESVENEYHWKMNMGTAFSKTGGLIQSQLSASAKTSTIERILKRRGAMYKAIRP